LLTRSGIPPDGFEFFHARTTVKGWFLPCPACCRGWVPIVPDGDGYRLGAEVGCSRGCAPEQLSWWHLWRLGELPPRLAKSRPPR